MKITLLILGVLAAVVTNIQAEPIKLTINRSGAVGSSSGHNNKSIKNPKRDSSDQTAVEDKTGQSYRQQQQAQPQTQSGFVPTGQYYAQAATPQVNYAKPEGGIEYAKPDGGVQYASSAYRAPAYQTIAYSAHHPGHGAQLVQQNQKLLVAGGIQYAHQPQVQYYTPSAPPQPHYAQYTAAPVQQFAYPVQAFAAYPTAGHHAQLQQQLQLAFGPQLQHHQQQLIRGGGGGIHYATAAPLAAHHQPQYAIFAAPGGPVHTNNNFVKYPTAALNHLQQQQQQQQPAIIYASHPGQFYTQPGYYHQQPQPAYHQYVQPTAAYQPVQQNYVTIQPTLQQYSGKHLTGPGEQVTQLPVQNLHYKNYISAVAQPQNGGASSFSTYSAHLPSAGHLNGGNGAAVTAVPVQLVKATPAPIVYATTSAPSSVVVPAPAPAFHQLQHPAAGRIYYAATGEQQQEQHQGYHNGGAIHYGTHLYHPAGGKAIISPAVTATSAGIAKY